MGYIILKVILIGVGILAILSLGIGIFQQDGLFIVVGILLAIMTWLIYAQTRQSLNNPFNK
ncbi:MAG TPA: hypothetical protein DCE70_10955 [Acinetobacter sp.]|uniref:hypothetical protein n=1 Tax=Acinetobacter variabilis TaxID=70346 RepID=UPI000EC8CA44|nr:hypothetical protein [Acinetobacter variabilis]HAB44028.1 hypothetical protein [Acinetobacter sp.]